MQTLLCIVPTETKIMWPISVYAQDKNAIQRMAQGEINCSGIIGGGKVAPSRGDVLMQSLSTPDRIKSNSLPIPSPSEKGESHDAQANLTTADPSPPTPTTTLRRAISEPTVSTSRHRYNPRAIPLRSSLKKSPSEQTSTDTTFGLLEEGESSAKGSVAVSFFSLEIREYHVTLGEFFPFPSFYVRFIISSSQDLIPSSSQNLHIPSTSRRPPVLHRRPSRDIGLGRLPQHRDGPRGVRIIPDRKTTSNEDSDANGCGHSMVQVSRGKRLHPIGTAGSYDECKRDPEEQGEGERHCLQEYGEGGCHDRVLEKEDKKDFEATRGEVMMS